MSNQMSRRRFLVQSGMAAPGFSAFPLFMRAQANREDSSMPIELKGHNTNDGL